MNLVRDAIVAAGVHLLGGFLSGVLVLERTDGDLHGTIIGTVAYHDELLAHFFCPFLAVAPSCSSSTSISSQADHSFFKGGSVLGWVRVACSLSSPDARSYLCAYASRHLRNVSSLSHSPSKSVLSTPTQLCRLFKRGQAADSALTRCVTPSRAWMNP